MRESKTQKQRKAARINVRKNDSNRGHTEAVAVTSAYGRHMRAAVANRSAVQSKPHTVLRVQILKDGRPTMKPTQVRKNLFEFERAEKTGVRANVRTSVRAPSRLWLWLWLLARPTDRISWTSATH